jgi:hypothetical protein
LDGFREFRVKIGAEIDEDIIEELLKIVEVRPR